MVHYTDDEGYKGIASQPTWHFKVSKPTGPHAVGVYFTTLMPDTPSLCARLRIPRRKIAFVFEFSGSDGLRALEGGRGAYIFWSAVDYYVNRPRQVYHGPTGQR